jgi:hypothetical protein
LHAFYQHGSYIFGLFDLLLGVFDIVEVGDDPVFLVDTVLGWLVAECEATTVIPVIKDNDFPLAGEAFRTLDSVEVCFCA